MTSVILSIGITILIGLCIGHFESNTPNCERLFISRNVINISDHRLWMFNWCTCYHCNSFIQSSKCSRPLCLNCKFVMFFFVFFRWYEYTVSPSRDCCLLFTCKKCRHKRVKIVLIHWNMIEKAWETESPISSIEICRRYWWNLRQRANHQ